MQHRKHIRDCLGIFISIVKAVFSLSVPYELLSSPSENEVFISIFWLLF